MTMAHKISHRKLSDWNLLKMSTVIFSCNIEIINAVSTPKRQFQASLSEHSLLSNVHTFFNDPKHSDVTVTVGEKKFFVHKLILISRSSVFAAVFEHEMKEKVKNNIDITDMKEEVVEELLKFIYTDTTERLGDMKLELLDASEKYDIKKLKILCVQYLRDNLDIDNAAERLIIADRYNVKEMKDYILNFISANRKKVILTHGFKVMEEIRPDLLLEAFKMLWDN